jgi:4-amino-4-deoxy-L-arabinose transferase-like glycosyltransferase
MNTTVSKYEKHLSIIYRKRTPELIIASAAIATGLIVSYMLFVRDQHLLLYYGDSISHLLISRRLVDSIIPGLAQLGGVWLPMTHILLSPFVINDFLFHTGFAGTIVSIVCTAIGAVALFRIVRFQFNSVPAGLLASSLYLMNPSVIYMGIVPMMEAPFMMFFLLSVYYVQKWYYIYSAGEDTWNQYRTILKCGLVVSAASLTRYEGWILPFGLIGLLALIQLILVRRKEWRYRFEAIILVAIIFGSLGITMWVLWNTVIFKDPLYFATGPYSAQVQADVREFNDEFKLNPIRAISVIFDVATAMYGLHVLVISILGIITYLYMGGKNKVLSFSFLTIIMLLPLLIDFIAMIQGSGEIFPTTPGRWFNGRYLIFLAPLVAFGSASLVIFISKKRKKVLTMSVVVIVIALYTFTIVSQPFDTNKANIITGGSNPTALKSIFEPQTIDFQHAKEIGSVLGNKLKPGEHVVLFVERLNTDTVMFFSRLPLKSFIDVSSGHYWTTSLESPWVHGKYVIREKAIGFSTSSTYDPLIDLMTYWEHNKSTLMEHYNIIYENNFFELLEKKKN